MHIGATTKIVGVIGWPLGHTLSPAIHNAAFKKAGLDWVYLAFPTHPERLGEAVCGFKALGIAGINVTIPHKEAVMEYLDEISGEAATIGAVNTVSVEADKILGTNTDAYGFLQTLEEEGCGTIRAKRVAIIGSGGVSRAIATACASENAEALILTDILLERAISLRTSLIDSFPGSEVKVFEPGNRELYDEIGKADILINATPLGMKPDDPLPIEREFIRPETVVFDAVYNPAETAFLTAARGKGCKTIGGLGMLVHQGAKSFEIWTGVKPDVELMKQVMREKLLVE